MTVIQSIGIFIILLLIEFIVLNINNKLRNLQKKIDNIYNIIKSKENDNV